jgi:hypothetical protein
MGMYNSSITRVRPFFRILFGRDASGHSWLPGLLKAATRSEYAQTLAKNPGGLDLSLLRTRDYRDDEWGGTIALESCFEKCFPPPERFLLWLIHNPTRMSWPRKSDGPNAAERTFGEQTQTWRKRLFNRDDPAAVTSAQVEAQDQLTRNGVRASSLRWWAFEGETHVDCYLETDRLVLLVEGKREEHLSSSTSWFPRRNQLWRNLEVAAGLSNGKRFALMLLAENAEPEPPIAESLPHLESYERDFLTKHYLGCVLWTDACRATGIESALPHTVEDSEP